MNKVSTIICIITLFVFAASTQAQYERDYDYSVETVGGIMKATNSGLIGGFSFKYAKALKKNNWFHGALIEVANIKHPQEQRYYSESGNTFIWGKEHYLYSLRLSYLREYRFFKKAPKQGVQVNGFLALGPTLGFEAPYYVEVRKGGYTVKEPYDPNKHQYQDIVGPGNVLQGVGESSIVPGMNAKAAMAFEFGSFKSNVIGLEVGFQADFFTRKIIIMPTTINYSIFPSAYATLFYGGRR